VLTFSVSRKAVARRTSAPGFTFIWFSSTIQISSFLKENPVKSVLRILALFLASLAPLLTQAQAVPATQTVIGVDFKVVIPRFVKITAEQSPTYTNARNEQVIEIETSANGACIQIVNQRPDVEWSVDITSPGWLGWGNNQKQTFCNLQKGKHTFSAVHSFNWSGIEWPLRTIVSTAP
jgi:hypothetical protein